MIFFGEATTAKQGWRRGKIFVHRYNSPHAMHAKPIGCQIPDGPISFHRGNTPIRMSFKTYATDGTGLQIHYRDRDGNRERKYNENKTTWRETYIRAFHISTFVQIGR